MRLPWGCTRQLTQISEQSHCRLPPLPFERPKVQHSENLQLVTFVAQKRLFLHLRCQGACKMNFAFNFTPNVLTFKAK